MTFEIRVLDDDKLITEPGFYQMSLDRHHGQPCNGPSVTSGVLRRMELHGPSKVWATHQWNPNRYPSADSDALRTGRAMAAFIDGGADEVEKFFQILPDDKPKRPSKDQMRALREGRESATAKKSIAFWGSVDRDKRDILSETQFTLICDMGEVLSLDPAAAAVLGGIPEITMAWFDEPTQLWCLARPDNTHFDGTVSDFKKVNIQGAPFTHFICDRRIEKHGYHMQMAFACEGFEQLSGGWVSSAGLVFQEDVPPHDVILREIAEEDLRIGQFLNHQSLIRIRECLDANHWPGPGEDTGAFQMSDRLREKTLERMQTGATSP